MNDDILNNHKMFFIAYLDNKYYAPFVSLGAIILSCLSPLYVMSILKQISVPAHKDIYDDPLIKNKGKYLNLFQRTYLKITGKDESIFDKKLLKYYDNYSKMTQEFKDLQSERLNKSTNSPDNNKLNSNYDKENITHQKNNKNTNYLTDENLKNKSVSNVVKVEHSKNNELIKSNIKEMNYDRIEHPVSIRDYKNKSIITNSGVSKNNHPYRAPIFDTFKEIFQTLNRQGILSFWKGNFYRYLQIYLLFFNRPYLDLIMYSNDNMRNFMFGVKSFNNNFYEIINLWATYSFIEVLTHPLFVIETRYVLQNRLPEYRIYKSLVKVFIRSKLELLSHGSGHLIKNAFFSAVYIYSDDMLKKPSYLIDENTRKYILSYNIINNNLKIIPYILGHTASYPVQTALRRLVCQSNGGYSGLLPVRYINTIHAISLIKREEGVIYGLYKGYLPYLIATSLFYKLTFKYLDSFFKKLWEDNYNIYNYEERYQ